MRRRPMLVLSTALLLCALACSAKTVYVKWDSPGPTFDGASWATALHKVQDGLNATASGDELWVAKGTYVERVTLKDGVGLYGGFIGTEAERYQRDFKANETILDGNGAGPVVQSPSGVTETARLDGFTVRNGYLYWLDGAGIRCTRSSPVITNNIITDNRAIADCGGIACYYSSPIIRNNIIARNAGDDGAGIHCEYSSPVITNNTISQNEGYRAVYSGSGSSPTIVGNVIKANPSSGVFCSSGYVTNNTIVQNNGSGIYCSSQTTVSNNLVAFNSYGIYGDGGTPVLRNNCVYGNTYSDYYRLTAGTGDFSLDPRLVSSEYGNVHIRSTSPCRNRGYNGAPGLPATDMDGHSRIISGTVDVGADEYDGTTWPIGPYTLVRVSPSGNDANDGSSWALPKKTVQAAIDVASALGGEVWVQAGTYAECIILRPYAYVYGGFRGTETSRSERGAIGRRTVLNGGGKGTVVRALVGANISRIDGFTICNGGGVDCSGASPTIANNVITGNSRGIVCYGSTIVTGNTITQNGTALHCGSSPVVSNNIIAFNRSGISGAYGGTPVLRNNCVFGNKEYDYSGLAAGTGDISLDPGLADTAYGDPHIQPGSPCIDAGYSNAPGLSAVDLDGQLRVQGGAVDIGADESDATTNWPRGPYAIVRVSPSGSDAHDGSSWALAKKTVQAAIDATLTGGGEVWVRAGTYDERIALCSYTYLYGGFAGTESQRSERDWVSNRTIIDPSVGGSIATIVGHEAVVLDGFTLRGGGAQYGGGIHCSASAIISHNTITNNVASPAIVEDPYGSSGGGIYLSGGYPTITRNTISGNTNYGWDLGGGIACYSSSPTIAGNIITRNSAASSGGGIGICNSAQASPPVIANNVISDNYAEDYPDSGGGGGIRCQGASATIVNNVLAFNNSGIYVSTYPPKTPVLQNNCVFGNIEYNYSWVSPGIGDISADPLFVNRAGGDYHLTAISPCINAGLNDATGLPLFDMDGEGRIFGGKVDIGADEYWSPTMSESDAKRAADGARISGGDATVSAVFDGAFYVEADDRSSGIRVEKPDHGLHVGDRAEITGELKTSADGERYIEALMVVANGTGMIPPLGLPNRSIGGAGWFYDAVSGSGQAGQKEYRPVYTGGSWINTLMDVPDLNNIGLLISTTGRVTYIGDVFFYLDDGSHLDDGSGHIGVRVALEGQSMPALDSYMKVTGVSSCYKREGSLFRLLRATAITQISR